MTNVKTRKNISYALVGCMLLALGASSLAFFSDKADIGAVSRTGELAVGIDGFSNSTFVEKTYDWVPGDNVNFTYTVENDGTKNFRAQETITLTVTPTEGRVITAEDVSKAKLTIKGKDGIGLTTAADPTIEAHEDGYVLTYVLPEFELPGLDKNSETRETAGNAKAVTYSLDFDKAALNEYQAADIEVAVHVDAIQAEHTEEIATNEVHKYGTIEQELIITDESGNTN